MNKVIEWLLSLLYPKRCPFCRRLMNENDSVCRLCINTLPLVPLSGQKQHFPFVDECFSVFYFEDTVRKSLHRYKFSGAAAYAGDYAEFILKSIDENQISCDIITWVPLSRRRLRRRGYDQAELLARCISKEMGWEIDRLLVKKKNNAAQSGTGNAEKRRANVSGVYEVTSAEKVKDKHIILVDDIVTTGATVSECARMLKKSGADRVTVLTVARKRP